ncbi:hypothetical protein BDR04DRAFT_1120324 [Suillus decipiens]|nr:hypothetical protein BDR04DRAFT_1120324 [Suillus decipiens]
MQELGWLVYRHQAGQFINGLFYSNADPSEDSDHMVSDCEDGPVLPEITVDDDGISLKGQQELIRSIFHISYKICTGSSRPIPWGVITASTSNYLEPGSVPTEFVVKDPSHVKTEEANHLWMHWE